MFNKIYNIICFPLIIAAIVCLYLFDLTNTNIYLCIVGIYVFIYILVMALKKEKIYKIFLYPLIGSLTLFGVINLTLMTCSAINYEIVKTDSKIIAEGIESSASTYKQIFEDDNYSYYVDRDISVMAQISKRDSSNIISYPVQTADKVSNDFSIFSPFYDISIINGVNKTSDYQIHFAFMKDVQEASLLLRLVINEKIYYTYLVPDNISTFIKNINGFNLLKTEGFTDFYISENTISVDMKDLDSDKPEVDATQETTGLLTVTDRYYIYSQGMYVKYTETPDYVTRINNFYNREMLENIKQIKAQILETPSDSDTYQELQSDLLNYQSSLQNYYVELVNESVLDNMTIRYYRTYLPDETSTDIDFDIVSIVEISLDDGYFIAGTNIDTNQLFRYSTNQ